MRKELIVEGLQILDGLSREGKGVYILLVLALIFYRYVVRYKYLLRSISNNASIM